jgi:putative membrane protein
MTTDAWLAIAHHLAIFGVAFVLAAEWALVRPGIDATGVARLARVDAVYGAFAGMVLAAGVARVVWGAKPADFYLESTTFWLKMVSFATVGLLSIRPTIRYLRWRGTLDESGPPTDDEVGWAQRMVAVQLAVFLLIPVFAALMARGIGD